MLHYMNFWFNAVDIETCICRSHHQRSTISFCGIEFGEENVGKRAVIKRVLYGGKTSGHDFRNLLRSCMEDHMKFKPCLSNPDVWRRSAVKSDGTPHYQYIMLCVDDVLCIAEEGKRILHEELGYYFHLKKELVGPPTLYLGAKLSNVTLENGSKAIAMSSTQY